MNREIIMGQLFNLLTAPPMVFNFTADTATGSTELGSVSDTSGLLIGMPINGPGIVEHSYLASTEPTVTVSLPATADNTAAPMTQGFQTATRRLARAFEEADKPALYLIDTGENHYPRQSNEPGRIILECEIWIFSDAGEDPDPALTPATEINRLLDAVHYALDPGPTALGGRRQNLGVHGVHFCRIEGEVQKDPGYAATIAGAIVPIKIMVMQDIDNYLLETIWDRGATAWDGGTTHWDRPT